MRNSKIIKNLVFSNLKIELITAISLSVVLILSSVFIVSKLPLELKIERINLNNQQLFIDGDEADIDVSEFNKIFTYSPLETLDFEHYQVVLPIDITNFTYSENITTELYGDLAKINGQELKFYVYPDYTDDLVKEYHIPNQAYNINYFLAGSYPEEDEVVVSEYIANILLTEYELESFDKLLGHDLNFTVNDKNYTYQISGVTAGGKDILVDGESEIFTKVAPAEFGYYKEFDSKEEKNKFIIEVQNDKNVSYIDSSNFNQINISHLILLTSFCLEILFVFAILYYPLKRVIFILRYYRNDVKWYLVLTYPALLIISIILINIILSITILK